jgi:hypothetical protein
MPRIHPDFLALTNIRGAALACRQKKVFSEQLGFANSAMAGRKWREYVTTIFTGL